MIEFGHAGSFKKVASCLTYAGTDGLPGGDEVSKKTDRIIVIVFERKPGDSWRADFSVAESMEPGSYKRGLAETCRSGYENKFSFQSLIEPLYQTLSQHPVRSPGGDR